MHFPIVIVFLADGPQAGHLRERGLNDFSPHHRRMLSNGADNTDHKLNDLIRNYWFKS